LAAGAVRVDARGLIEAVGPTDRVPVSGARVVELGDAVILPGLVNVHAHPELTVLRGRIEDSEFTDWIERLVEFKYEYLTAGELQVSTWLGAAEAIAAGTTCLAAPDDAGFLLEALRECGLRGRVYREVFGPAPDQAREALAELRAKTEEALPLATERVDVGVSPHAPFSVSQRLFGLVAEYASAEGLPVCIHAAESEAEEAYTRLGRGTFADRLRARGIEVRAAGKTPIAWLAETGILGTQPLLVHCVRVEPEDIVLVADSGASVAHCPISNAKFGHGVAPLPDFISASTSVGLGSDSVASNNRADILAEARFAALVQRSVRRDPELLGPDELLRLATLDGAGALGLGSRIGSLEPGKQADIIAVRLWRTHSTPPGDPVAALFHSACASDVVLTIVGGRVLYRDGAFTTLDWPALAQATERMDLDRRETP
jgi:5-methylthioadenosine/S-adenosylhomocysteine deaminase